MTVNRISVLNLNMQMVVERTRDDSKCEQEKKTRKRWVKSWIMICSEKRESKSYLLFLFCSRFFGQIKEVRNVN